MLAIWRSSSNTDLQTVDMAVHCEAAVSGNAQVSDVPGEWDLRTREDEGRNVMNRFHFGFWTQRSDFCLTVILFEFVACHPDFY